MIERSIEIKTLFETRPAALFVQTASKFNSRISLQADSKTANAKSIMGVISLGLTEGQIVKLTADGEDEAQAVPALEQFLRALVTQ